MSIDMWLDPWVPWLERFKPSPKDNSIARPPMAVSSLILPRSRQSNVEVLNELFDSESVRAILQSKIG